MLQKKEKKRSNWTNSHVLSLYIYVAKKREKTKQLNQLSCPLFVYLCCIISDTRLQLFNANKYYNLNRIRAEWRDIDAPPP